MNEDDRITAWARRASTSLLEPVWHAELSDGGATRVLVLRAPSMRVGSHEGNDLVLRERTVSRSHAELTPTREGVRVRDLGSRNGTSVDGVRVIDALVTAGQTIVFGGGSSLKVRTLEEEPLDARTSFGALEGRTEAMARLFLLAERAAGSDATVLVQAESGCGKELLTRSIHDASPRREAPFVVFDCAAIAPSLIESALFGHERGAFTGATEKRVGLIEEAAGGTLFIDEIGELPLSLQPRLLRFLERREVQRVGSNQVRTFDVRVIAATHRNLLAAINERTFREDLYFRLAVMRLRIPPLRERVGDLPRLVESLLTQRLGSAERAKEKLNTVSPATWDTLKSLPWRGNVRELRNVLDHSLALSPDGALTFEFDSEALPTPNPTSGPAPAVDLSQPFITQRDAMLEGFERVYLGGILEKAEGNFSRAAALAGLDRMHLKRLLRRHGLGS